MPTNQNYDPRSGRAGGNYGGTGRRSSGGFGSGSGMGSSGSGFGSGGFGSRGSMGSGANVGQGFGNIDQSSAGTFGTGGLMGMGFNTRTTDGGRTRIGSDMYGNPTYQQNFNVLEGASGTPGGGRGGQIGIGGGSLPSYDGGGFSFGNYPQNNAGTSAAPNYQGGYSGPTAGGYGPAYEQAMQSTYTPGGFDPGNFSPDPTSSPEYAVAMNAPGDPGGAMMGSPQSLMDFINQYRSGVGASQVGGSASTVEEAQGLIQQDNLQRQYDQNQGYINSLPSDQQSNEQTAQNLGYLSYQAYLNDNPGQTMPGAQGIPGAQPAGPAETGGGGFQRTPGPQVQPYTGMPSGNPQGSYDPRTGTAYTPGFGGGPSQDPRQNTSQPGAYFPSPPPASQSPYPAKKGPTGPMGDPFSTGGASGPQTQAGGAGRQSIDPYGAGGYAPAGSGRTGARGEIGPDGNPIPFEPPQEGGGIFQGGKGVTRTADQNPGLYGSMPQALTMAPGSSPEETRRATEAWNNMNGRRSSQPAGNQPIEGGIDMNWLGQDGRYLGGGAPLYGGQNSPMATNPLTGEQIMAPGGGGGGGGFNPFGAVSRPEMTYPGGGTPQPNEPFFGGQNSPMVTNPTGETLMAPGFNPFGAVTRPEMTAYTPGWGGGPSQAPPQSGGYPAKQGPSGPMGDPLGGWSQRIPWNNGGTVNGRPGFDTRGYIPGKGYYMS